MLASSRTSLVVLPPADLEPGRASVDISCAKRYGPPLEVVFVALSLEADSSPLTPGVHRQLTVHVRGTRDKVTLEARNLAPDIAELTGGNPLQSSSSGGWENAAHFEIVGRKRGSFQISIRMLPFRAATTLGRAVRRRRGRNHPRIGSTARRAIRLNFCRTRPSFPGELRAGFRASLSRKCKRALAVLERRIRRALVPASESKVFSRFSTSRLSASP